MIQQPSDRTTRRAAVAQPIGVALLGRAARRRA
jgi:hypothetical protein